MNAHLKYDGHIKTKQPYTKLEYTMIVAAEFVAFVKAQAATCNVHFGKIQWTNPIKAQIIEKMRSSGVSVNQLAIALGNTSGLACYSTWNAQLHKWGKAYDQGRYKPENAVASRTVIRHVTSTENPFHSVLDVLVLREGRTLAEVESLFASALDRKKFDLTKSALDSMETILKSKGLTLDDLKKAL